jgi:hypothetical protein
MVMVYLEYPGPAYWWIGSIVHDCVELTLAYPV